MHKDLLLKNIHVPLIMNYYLVRTRSYHTLRVGQHVSIDFVWVRLGWNVLSLSWSLDGFSRNRFWLPISWCLLNKKWAFKWENEWRIHVLNANLPWGFANMPSSISCGWGWAGTFNGSVCVDTSTGSAGIGAGIASAGVSLKKIKLRRYKTGYFHKQAFGEVAEGPWIEFHQIMVRVIQN